MPDRLTIGRDLPGLPSDLAYLRLHGPRLIEKALASALDQMRVRTRARVRAEGLLRQHLSDQQLASYSTHVSFDVASRYTDQLVYRIQSADWGASVSVCATDTRSPLEGFSEGVGRLPHVGTTIREAATKVFGDEGAVRLCLRVLGLWLPAADSALAFKLFVETDEIRIWTKGMRIYLSMQPEIMTFTEVQT
jgi:hypothetical protein